jgi:class 3 adenylate cyclase
MRSDLVDQLQHELGAERYAEALADHRRLSREAFARHGGVEVDRQGDAFFYAFPSPQRALEAARDGQEALSAGSDPRASRLAHGHAFLTDEGYVGDDSTWEHASPPQPTAARSSAPSRPPTSPTSS